MALVRNSLGALAISLIVLNSLTALAQLPAFPGAQGYGAAATGGRGGEVFHVINTLNTSTGTYEGPNGYNRGTLRWAMTNTSSSLPRTIVFDVGGAVTLTSQITVENSNLTIAGQTAPGQGFTSQGRPWLFENGNNIIFRHYRNRLGRNGGQDSMGVEGGTNLIFDHITSTWSNDEALSVAKDGNRVTVQNSFIYEGLNHSEHGYGSLIRPDINSQVSYHHNLYANNESRNPRPGTYNNSTLDFDFRNNVVYNWGDRAGYSGGSEGTTPEHVNMNFVGNYAISGPSTSNNATYAFVTDTNADLRAYQSGNLIDSDLDAVRDGVDTGWGMFRDDASNPGVLTQLAAPHPLATHPVTTHSATSAYNNVLDYAGAYWWSRDTADNRIVNQVRTQTGSLINHESDVGGFPVIAASTRAANFDVDHDGMSDAWEQEHGLNPALSSDRNLDFDTDGFTNLEEYLNELGAWPAAEPISWNGGTGRFALNANWSAWQPSRFDEVRVNAGTATIDAIGQQTGTLRLGTSAGAAPAVNITAGWLESTNDVVIGVDSTAAPTLRLSGGELRTPLLSKSAGGTFLMTGGTLRAEMVAFSMTNQGGKIAPGRSLGVTQVQGDLTLATGSVELELGGTAAGQFDRVAVSGALNAGGSLTLLLVNGFSPAAGQSFDLLNFTSSTGAFTALNLPTLTSGLSWNTSQLLSTGVLSVAAGLPGDYSGNGVVDAADYTTYRDALGTNTSLPNDTTPGSVTNDDYAVWQASFGQGGPSVASAVPEPASVALLLAFLVTTSRTTYCPRRVALRFGASLRNN